MSNSDNNYGDGFPFSREGEDFKQGLSLMQQVLGDEDAAHIESLLDNPLFGEELGYVFSKTWGALYAREGLDLKQRALILMGTDLALGREGPLKDHMRVALHGGLSPKQIIEVLFQTVFYIGAPALVLGLRVANEVLGPHINGTLEESLMENNNFKQETIVNDLGVRLGPINHVAMAVKDWKETAKGYASLMGLNTWRVMEISSEMMETAEYYGKPADFVWISAFARMGDTLIELCQPVSGETVFADFVNEHGDGMQHVGDLSHPEPLELVRKYTSQGVKVGNYCNIPGVVELFYLDTRDQLGGMFLEVVAPPTYAQIAAMGDDFTF